MGNKLFHVQFLLTADTCGSHIGLQSASFQPEIPTSGTVYDDVVGQELQSHNGMHHCFQWVFITPVFFQKWLLTVVLYRLFCEDVKLFLFVSIL